MAVVLTLIKAYLLPVIGCVWAGTLAYDRGGDGCFGHPLSGVVLALLVGKRCFCCRARISYAAPVRPRCGC